MISNKQAWEFGILIASFGLGFFLFQNTPIATFGLAGIALAVLGKNQVFKE